MNSTNLQKMLRVAISAAAVKHLDPSNPPPMGAPSPWRNTFMVWGPPAVGKTASIETAFLGMDCPRCSELSKTDATIKVHPIPVVTRHLSEMMPEDLRGVLIYNPAKDLATWHHNPDWRIGTECPVCYFLDEFNQAEKPTQKGALEFTHKHSMGGESLPPGSIMILAGNRVEDGADVEELIRPQRTRVIHINYEFDPVAWHDWALKNGVHHFVRSFLRAKEGLLYKPDMAAERGECLPRTWHKVSDIMHYYPAELQTELVTGTVGDGASAEFMGWVNTSGTLMPLIDKVLAGSDDTADDLSSQFFVTGVLVDRFMREPKLSERLCQYAIASKSANPEAAALMLKDAAKVNRDKMLASPSWKKAMAALAQFMTA